MSKKTSGIYKITNDRTGEVYVGQSNNIEKRWEQHEEELKNGTHHNSGLQEDFNNGDSFTYEIIAEEKDKQKREDKEMIYIQRENSFLEGYNQTLGGGYDKKREQLGYYGGRLPNSEPITSYGLIISEEPKHKIKDSEKQKEEMIRYIRNSNNTSQRKSELIYKVQTREIKNMYFLKKEMSNNQAYAAEEKRERKIKTKPRQETFQEKIRENPKPPYNSFIFDKPIRKKYGPHKRSPNKELYYDIFSPENPKFCKDEQLRKRQIELAKKYHTTENYIIKKEKELEEKRLKEQRLKEQRLEEQRLKELNEKYGENESLIIFLLIITIFLILLLICSVY